VERVITLTPGNVLKPVPPPRDLAHRGEAFRPGRKLSDTLGSIERKNLTDALERADGNQSLAARMLGVSERSIRYKLRKYGLRVRQSRRIR
jgi:transcriptional regulator with GAF, ATPase, and Fis domain